MGGHWMSEGQNVGFRSCLGSSDEHLILSRGVAERRQCLSLRRSDMLSGAHVGEADVHMGTRPTSLLGVDQAIAAS
jgi:hypothetical protein